MDQSNPDQQIGYIVRSYPRLSQTFILNEILHLEKIGVALQVFAITNPRETVMQPEVAQVRAQVQYLEEMVRPPVHRRANIRRALSRFGLHYANALLYTLFSRAVDRGYHAASRWELFEQASALALRIDDGRQQGTLNIHHLHAHFAHDPAFIAQLVHLLTGLPYSFTAHARDLYQIERRVLVERMCGATGVVTCCRNNLNYLESAAPALRERFHLVYHGVNLERFHPAPPPSAAPASAPEPPVIVSIGRLIEKKGYLDLLQALLRVKAAGMVFRCDIYGEGPLEAALQAWIDTHGLGQQVRLLGSRTQQELIAAYQSASLFALTPFVTDDGDQDGVPNVLVEAMAVGLPVVSTRAVGVPELVTHRHTGLLYDPHDVEGIAAGICELLDDTRLRATVGSAARQRVTEQFDVTQAAYHLRDLFARGKRQPRNVNVRLFRKPACA